MESYDIEELVLGLADIVRENRYLRQENTRLREVEKEYHQSIIDRCRELDENELDYYTSVLAY
nr:MAG TPA: Initiation-control protein YabA, DnaA, DnaN, Zinc finger.7A [Bacteriophage sp.]